MGRQLDIVDLNIYYDQFLAVANVNMRIEACRITALIGPPGTGKSTVLRTLNRLHEVPPRRRIEGKVLLDGQDIYAPDVDINAIRRMIGMVFQQPNPFPTLSVYENAVAGLLLAPGRVRKSVLDETAESALRRANLWDEVKDRLKAPGASLSGGQQQRLCIARAIAVNPEVLLLDEPASALDPTSTWAIEDLLLSLKKDITVVIVTHNMEQAARISDRTGFFHVAGTGMPGELVEIDETDTIFAHPSDPRTDGYVTGRFG